MPDISELRFAPDSPVEGAGFEPSATCSALDYYAAFVIDPDGHRLKAVFQQKNVPG
jgi:hypothetical protein